MRGLTLAIGLSLLAACGSAETPEVVYEKGLDDQGYLDCMVDLLLLNDQCRLQRDQDIFESCMLQHHAFCRDSHEELKRGGIE
jgi:hypothetical protein